jgi:hypothetical protein
MAYVKCPPISDELITYLDNAFPDHALDPRDEQASTHYGQVTVVRHLKAVKHTQEEYPDVST